MGNGVEHMSQGCDVEEIIMEFLHARQHLVACTMVHAVCDVGVNSGSCRIEHACLPQSQRFGAPSSFSERLQHHTFSLGALTFRLEARQRILCSADCEAVDHSHGTRENSQPSSIFLYPNHLNLRS